MERSKLIASNQRIAQLLQEVAEGDQYAASDEDEDGEAEEDDYEAGEGGDAAEEVEAA